MASKTIPIIDFCNPNLKPGSAEWESTKSKVFKAMEECSCFEAIYDKIPNETEQEIFGAAKETLSLESKMREFTVKPFERYPEFPRSKYGSPTRIIADMLLPECIQTFANTFWPHDGNPHFCKSVKSYTDALVELDAMVKMMVCESLGLTDYLKFMDEHIYFFRFVKYTKEVHEGEDVSNPRVDCHTDTGFLTTLKQDRPGLQILMPNGEWVDPSVSPLSYVVLVSDSFMAWTNGRLKAAFHRVKYDDPAERLSAMLFSSSKPGHIIEAPKELVDEKHPTLYKPFDAIDHFDKVSETVEGKKTKAALQDYYAV